MGLKRPCRGGGRAVGTSPAGGSWQSGECRRRWGRRCRRGVAVFPLLLDASPGGGETTGTSQPAAATAGALPAATRGRASWSRWRQTRVTRARGARLRPCPYGGGRGGLAPRHRGGGCLLGGAGRGSGGSQRRVLYRTAECRGGDDRGGGGGWSPARLCPWRGRGRGKGAGRVWRPLRRGMAVALWGGGGVAFLPLSFRRPGRRGGASAGSG